MAFVAQRSHEWRLVWRGRAAGLACLAVLTAVWMSYMARAVPVRVHTLPEQLAPKMTMTAVVALLVMVAVDAVILILVVRQQRDGGSHPASKRPSHKGVPAALLPIKAFLPRCCPGRLASEPCA